MPDGPKTQAAAQQLVNCISTACCTPLPAIVPPVACSIASGHTGETLGTIAVPPV